MKITLTELLGILDQRQQNAALLLERALLQQQVLDLVAGDVALAEKVKTAFAKSEAVEARMRAYLAQHPAA